MLTAPCLGRGTDEARLSCPGRDILEILSKSLTKSYGCNPRPPVSQHSCLLYGKHEESHWPDRHQRIETQLPNADIWMFAVFQQKHD